MSVQTMALVAGVILAVGVIAPIIVAAIPSRQRDPHDRVAVGCLLGLSCAMLVPAGLLIFGVAGGHSTLVKVIFWILIVVVGYVAVMGTAMGIVRWRKERRWQREFATPSPASDEPQQTSSDRPNHT